MLINGGVINGGVINGATLPEDIFAISVGNILSITQNVVIISENSILNISQNVVLQDTSEGEILSITQEVVGDDGGAILTLTQIVVEPDGLPYNPSNPPSSTTIPHYVVRNGFYPMLVIGAYVWPDLNIHDSYSITQEENGDRLMTFTLLLRKKTAYGPVNFEAFDKAPVALNIYNLNGTTERIFTGTVNKVDIDLIKGSLTCSCIANRRDIILDTYYYQTQAIGYYDQDIMGESKDIFEQLEKRLTTVPYTVDVDRFGLIQLSSILPNSFPHYEFNDNEVYGNNGQKADPKVEKLLSSRVVNSVHITLTYQYQRKWHADATYSWDWDTDICEKLVDGLTFAQRSTIESAAKGTGWVMNKNLGLPSGQFIRWTELPPAGLYNCVGVGVPIPFTTVRISGIQYVQATDPLGHPIIGTDGKPILKATGGIVEDSRRLLAIGADWKTSYRWTQPVKETYNLYMSAPQSIFTYGVTSQDIQLGVDDTTDVSKWENYTKWTNEVSSNADDQRNKMHTAFNIAMNKAKTTIIKSHRDNRVTFNIPLTPSIEVYHTVYLNCTRIQAYGKVIAVAHYIDIADGDAYTQVTIAMSRALGSASDTAFSIPSIVQTWDDQTYHINLKSIYGEDPPENYQGFVGNKWLTELTYQDGQSGQGTNTYFSNIQEQFIVKAPDITEEYRKVREFSATGTYTVSIQNYLLTATFL